MFPALSTPKMAFNFRAGDITQKGIKVAING
jgi:hypothetical protein